jgi:hypothetical protein
MDEEPLNSYPILSNKSSGQVKVYKNSTLRGTVDVTAWPYYANSGYIGLWLVDASGSLLDDSLALALPGSAGGRFRGATRRGTSSSPCGTASGAGSKELWGGAGRWP